MAALRLVCPKFQRGLEVGVGTGRFAQALGIAEGVEPSAAMAHLAQARGIKVYPGQAENLPFAANRFNLLLMMTVLCFVTDRQQSLAEAWRVLQPGGYLLVGSLDPAIPWVAARLKTGSTLSQAKPIHMAQLQQEIEQQGFQWLKTVQTLRQSPTLLQIPEEPWCGHGEGGFVGMLLKKNGAKPMC